MYATTPPLLAVYRQRSYELDPFRAILFELFLSAGKLRYYSFQPYGLFLRASGAEIRKEGGKAFFDALVI